MMDEDSREIRVNPHVPVQVSRLGESQVTKLARVGFFSRMDAEMFGQCRRIRESLLVNKAGWKKTKHQTFEDWERK
jgi:hypothetical protein